MRSAAQRRFLTFVAVSMTAILLAAVPAAAQLWKGKGRLRGKIVDPDGKPYAGATIVLRLADHPEAGPEPLTSDAKGRWSYLGLTGGLWTLKVETEEYLPAEGTFRVSEGSDAGRPVEIELQAPAPEQIQATAVGEIERGNELFQAGQYGEARAAFEVALETVADADKPAVLRGIAQTHRFEENNDEALAALQEAIELAPDDVDTMRLLVSVLLAEGRNDEAEPYLARLPAEEKLDVASRLNLGIDLYNSGDLDGAVEHFAQAVADFPEEPEGYYYLGLCQLGKEQNAEAIAAFEKLLEIAPESPRVAEAQQFLEYLKSP